MGQVEDAHAHKSKAIICSRDPKCLRLPEIVSAQEIRSVIHVADKFLPLGFPRFGIAVFQPFMSLVPSAEQRGAEFFRDFGVLFDHIGIMMVAVLSVCGPHAVQIDLVCHFFAAEHFLISRDTFKNRFHGGNIFRKYKLKLFLSAFAVPDADVPAVPALDKIRPFELPQFRAPDADRLLQRHQPRVSRVFLHFLRLSFLRRRDRARE